MVRVVVRLLDFAISVVRVRLERVLAGFGLTEWMTALACFVAATIGSQPADVSMGASSMHPYWGPI